MAQAALAESAISTAGSKHAANYPKKLPHSSLSLSFSVSLSASPPIRWQIAHKRKKPLFEVGLGGGGHIKMLKMKP